MVLSERERRLLEEMETRLAAEDPSLASSLGAPRLRVGTRALLAAAGLVLGAALMAIGVGLGQLGGTVVALAGFLVLLAAATIGGEWLRARDGAQRAARPPRRARRAP